MQEDKPNQDIDEHSTLPENQSPNFMKIKLKNIINSITDIENFDKKQLLFQQLCSILTNLTNDELVQVIDHIFCTSLQELFQRVNSLPERNSIEKNKENSYSDFVLQLVQIDCCLLKWQDPGDAMLAIHDKIISAVIKELISFLHEYKIHKLSENSEQQEKQVNIDINQLQIKLENAFKTLKALCFSIEDWKTRQYYVSISKMHFKISQLIHLNCPARLNCQYRIDIPNYQTTFELRSSVFKTLAFLINPFENDVQQFLITNHNILLHLGPLITTFAQNILLNMSNFPQFISDASQNSSQTIIQSTNNQHHFTNIGATYLLRTLLIRNTNFISDVSSIPGLINSLIILSRFQRQKNYRQSEQNESIQSEHAGLIRSESILSLGWIQYFGNLNIQLLLINKYDYIHSVLLEGIGNCSGSFEQNTRATINAVEGINWLFIILNEGRDWCDKNHELKKQVEEEIEIGGGIEDLETPMFLNSEMNDEDSKWEALQTKRIVVSYW